MNYFLKYDHGEFFGRNNIQVSPSQKSLLRPPALITMFVVHIDFTALFNIVTGRSEVLVCIGKWVVI